MEKKVIKANIIVFIASFCTLVIELVAGRIMAPYVGVSLYTWTSIIGVVLAGISIGAYFGGLLADRHPHSITLGWLLFLSGIGALTIPPLTDLVGNAQFQTSLMVRILLITSIIFFIPSCLLGMISPVVVKLTLSNLSNTGNIVGKIYAFSTLGSIIGTFLTGFCLISWMGTRNILFTIAAILIFSAMLFGGFFSRRKTFFTLILLSGTVFWSFYSYAFKAPDDGRYAYFKESDYFAIKIAKYSARFGGQNQRQVKALILDHLIHSINDVNDPLYLDYEYLRMYEEFVRWRMEGRSALNSLFIGGGGYTFPRYLEVKYPQSEISVVEIDPEVTKVVHEQLGMPKNTRIHTYNSDGRWFVMNSPDKGRYDFIFGDAFNDLSIPYHLTTKEFAEQIAALLKPDGVLLANLIDSFESGAFMPAYVRTLEEVFGKGNVHLLSKSDDYRKVGISTFIVIACRQPIDLDAFTRATKRESTGSAMSFAVPSKQLRACLDKHPSTILTDDYVPVDNLIAPIFEERFGYKRQ